MDSNATYKSIAKAMSLFGGVQIFQIFISIIRGKVVAIFLGTTGMGISSLLISSTAIITSISGLGLNFSAVRQIAQYDGIGDNKRLSKTIIIFRKWIIFCSLLGATFIIVFSSYLSQLVFKSREYTWSFIWLSLIIVFNTLNNGNVTLMQGVRKNRDLAKATLYGSIIGLIISIPLYAYLGTRGIVPGMIVVAIASYLLSHYFARKIKIDKIDVPLIEIVNEGVGLAKLGIMMMVGYFIGTVTTFALNGFISNYGSLKDVGLYQAGTSITNQYIGLVFSAMAMDYFPRLSAISNENVKVCKAVNQQAEITILITAPLLTLMMLSAPLIIQVLLSTEFLVIRNFIRFIAFGMIFKAASFAVGYISFAKGDKKTFIILEVIGSNLVIFIANIIGYIYGGLLGMAISFIVSYFVYFIVVNIVTYQLYNFSFTRDFKLLFLVYVLILFTMLLILNIFPNIYGYGISIIIMFLCFFYSYLELDKRLDLKLIVRNIRNRFLPL